MAPTRQEDEMSDPVKAAVIYYSSTGNVYRLAQAAVEGAEKAGAQTRLRKAAELAPESAIAANEAWAATAAETSDIAEAGHDDLRWADVVLLGMPTRYGSIPAQLQQFIDTTGPLWQAGELQDKVYGAFTSSATAHGGQESTLLSIATVFHHWGGIIVPPGFTDAAHFAHGNPYGASHVSAGGPPGDTELTAAREQARRAVEVAAALAAGR